MSSDQKQMFQYKNNFYMNETVRKTIENFEAVEKKLILENELKNSHLVEKVDLFQVKNEYYFNPIENCAFLFLYHYHTLKNNMNYRIIKIDKELIPKLKNKIWRCWNGTIVTYVLDPLSNKKIDQLSIRSEILNCGAKSQIEFRTNDTSDYRKENLYLIKDVKKMSNIVNEKIVKEYQKNTNMKDLLISRKKVLELKKNSKIIYSHKNNVYCFSDEPNTILLLIHHKRKKCTYKILIDKKDYENIKQYYWYIQGVGINKRTRHPEHIVYAQNKTWKLHNFIYFNGILDDYLKNRKKNLIIDHLNRNPLDNRRLNLKLSTLQENNRNQNTRRNNKCGVTGVYQHIKGWIASRTIYPNGRFHNPKRRALFYSDFDTAVAMRKKLEKLSDEEFLSDKPTYALINN